MFTFLAGYSTSFNPTQYPGSEVINHITNDLNNLTIKNNYQGHDQLQVGNGAGLTIAHIGSSKLLTHHPFSLNEILYIPLIAKKYYQFDNSLQIIIFFSLFQG